MFPKETGKALNPLLMTSEMAAKFVEDAEAAQKAGQRPVIYTGAEPVPAIPVTVPRRRSVVAAPAPAPAPIPAPAPPKHVIQEEETEGIFAGNCYIFCSLDREKYRVCQHSLLNSEFPLILAIFTRSHTLQSPALQAKCNFKLTSAEPRLYYMPSKEPPSVGKVPTAPAVI